MRIIAGSRKGRSLKLPRGEVRPTADRVKETIFNVLGQWLPGERVLDLYAGAGSLGLEALSRGAVEATFVESSRAVMPTLAENVRALEFAKASTTVLEPVERALPKLARRERRYTLVFADPPYAARAGAPVLQALDSLGLVEPGGRVVIEHDRRETLPEDVGELSRVDERRFGDTQVTFFERRTMAADPAGSPLAPEPDAG